MSGRIVIIPALIVTLGVHSRVWAQPELDYQAPADCPDEAEVVRALDHCVELQPDGVDERIVIMRVARSSESEAPLTLEIILEGPDVGGTRQITGRDCTALVNAGVVIAALALGPRPNVLLLEPADLPDEPPQPEEPPVEVEVEATTPDSDPEELIIPEVQPEPRRALHLGGVLLGRLSVGAMPQPAAGVSIGLALGASRFRGELALEWVPRSVGHVQGDDSAGGRFALIAAEARFCGDVILRPVVLGLCVGLELGATRAEGFGVDVMDRAWVIWVAPEAGAVLRWAFTRSGRIALRFDASLMVPLYRTTFYFEGGDDVHRSAPVAGRLGLGLVVDFF